MRRLEHEYKIMGLAPYAKKSIDLLMKFLIAVLNLMDIKLILIKNQKILFFILRKNLEVRDLML